MAGRLWLRWLVGAYTALPPGEVVFVAGRHGKPEVRTFDRAGLCFNASRAAGVALFAFGLEAEVGVDVEQFREGLDIDGISRRALGAEAAHTLRSAPASERVARFTWMWARHEAAVKCRGAGLDERQWPEVSVGLWIADLQVADGFGAAVAARAAPQRIRMWDGRARPWA